MNNIRHHLGRLRLKTRDWLRPTVVLLSPNSWFSEIPPDFLIMGLGKSGTSALSAILDNHPEITSLPARHGPGEAVNEGHFFNKLAEMHEKRQDFEYFFNNRHAGFFRDLVPLVDKLDRQDLLNRFRRRYNAYLQRHKHHDSRLVGDKTPEYVFHLDLIEQLYPGVKKICVLRNHLDRIVSFHHMQIRKRRWHHNSIEDWEVESYCERIRKEYNALLSYTGTIRFLTFEQLTTSPEMVLTPILEYLEVSIEQTLIDKMIEAGRFERLAGRPRGVEDNNSHYRKGIAGEGRKELTLNQQKLVHQQTDSLACELMKKYNLSLSNYLEE